MHDKIRLLLTDLDDTLLTTDKQITEYTIQVFRKCKEQGILTGFATARAEMPSQKYIDILQPDVRILDNGGLVQIGDQTVIQTMMSAETVDGILSELRDTEGLGDVTVETGERFYSTCRNILEAYGPDYAHGIYYDYLNPLGQASYKMTVETKNPEAFYEVISHYPECRGFGFAMEDWFCICPQGVTKGNAVEKTAAYLQIPASEIAAFGDDVSDVEMLKFCGHGTAMINGLEEVKAIGKYVTEYDNDHDGVARFIEGHFLKQEVRCE